MEEKILFEVVRRDCGGYSAHSLAPHRITVEASALEDIPGAVERVLQSYLGHNPLPKNTSITSITSQKYKVQEHFFRSLALAFTYRSCRARSQSFPQISSCSRATVRTTVAATGTIQAAR
jgi:hypothetical protein